MDDGRPDLEPGARAPDRAVERCGDGSVDQRARLFQPAELAIARALAVRGAEVAGGGEVVLVSSLLVPGLYYPSSAWRSLLRVAWWP